ncbi:MAG: hypothetical protein QUU85_04295, partial [Candidatus Eisenbacteria bacterium]|nr:hypothetical protein [Candidatus Eisenbacteria bacterium]
MLHLRDCPYSVAGLALAGLLKHAQKDTAAAWTCPSTLRAALPPATQARRTGPGWTGLRQTKRDGELGQARSMK